MTGNLAVPLDPATMYWGVIAAGIADCPPGVAACPRTADLDAAFQPMVPVDLAALHTAYLPLSDGRILAAAIDPDSLRSLLRQGAVAAYPASAPPFLGELPGFAPAQFNLLIGEFVPSAVRSARRRREILAASAVVIVCGLALVGIERRRLLAAEAGLDADARVTAAATAADVRAANIDEAVNALRRTATSLAAARRTANTSDRNGAIHAAESVLASWPRGETAPHVRTTSVSISPVAVVLSVEADTRDDARLLIEALRTAPGWTLLEPEMRAAAGPAGSTADGPVSLTLRLAPDRRAASSTGAAR